MRKGALILPSYYEAIKDLPDEDRLMMYDCLVRYGLYGEVVDLPVHLKGYFTLIKPNMDSSRNKYSAACENGKKGGRPSKNQTINQTGNQSYNQDYEYDYDLEKDSDLEEESEKEKEGCGEKKETSPVNNLFDPETESDEDRLERLRNTALKKLESYREGGG